MADTDDKKPVPPSDVEDQTGEFICQCFQVTDETIKYHIREGKLKTIEEITEACGAGGGCQSCHMLLELFLDEFNKKEAPPKETPEKKKGFLSRLFSGS
jgi:bacterioferritin-associated ferredoxin